jgi:hypothetical protein
MQATSVIAAIAASPGPAGWDALAEPLDCRETQATFLSNQLVNGFVRQKVLVAGKIASQRIRVCAPVTGAQARLNERV